jgi:hypothetical protein
MVKIKYRGPKLTEEDMGVVKEYVKLLKKDVKGLKCPLHSDDSILHLRYIKETGDMEKHVNACCYEFENIIKESIPDNQPELT